MNEKDVVNLVELVQNEFGTTFTIEELKNTAFLVKRKCEMNKKGEDYVPLMFENELRNLAMRNIINSIGGIKECATFA